jgi:hypothetical protein
MKPEKFIPKNSYERMSGKSLSDKELFETKNNLLGFIKLLIEINDETHVVKFKKSNKNNINNLDRKEKSNEEQEC